MGENNWINMHGGLEMQVLHLISFDHIFIETKIVHA